MATVKYSASEIARIREHISGKRISTSKPDQLLVERLQKENLGLLPFCGLANEERALFEKLASDPRVARLSYVLFFPVLEPDLESDFSHITFKLFKTRSRGIAVRVKSSDKDVIIKPVQSPDDHKIATYAGEHDIGPIQHPTIDGFLTEEFLPGELFANISHRLDDNTAATIGKRVAEILSILHRAQILFNDTIFDNDFGGSHLLVDEKGHAKLIDFGVSIDLNNFPNLTDEQVFRILLTLPLLGGFIQSGMMSEAQIKGEIAKMRSGFALVSRDDVLRRDIDFVHEGFVITHHKNSRAAGIILDAFQEVYERLKNA